MYDKERKKCIGHLFYVKFVHKIHKKNDGFVPYMQNCLYILMDILINFRPYVILIPNVQISRLSKALCPL